MRPLTAPKLHLPSPRIVYLLSPFLTALTTWGLLLTQSAISRTEGGHVRPFGIGFLLLVAALAALGGRGPGLLTLTLSGVSLVLVLTPLGMGGNFGRPADWVELSFLLGIGGVLVGGLEAVRRNAGLLAAAEEARARLRAVMDTAPVGVLLSDKAGALVYANREAERIWGQPLAEAQVAETQKDEGDHGLLHGGSGLARALAGEAPIIHDERLIEQPDGTQVFVQASSTLVRDEAGRVRNGLAVFSDISARRAAEQEVQRLLARERLINRIGQATLRTQDPDRIQREAVFGLGELLGVDRCYLRLYDEDGDQTRVGEDWHRPDLPSLAGEHPVSESLQEIVSLYERGRSLVTPDARADGLPPAARAAFARTGIRAGIATPLFDGNRLTATLVAVMADGPRAWTAEEVSLVEAAATQMRAALEVARTRLRDQAIATALQDALLPALPARVPGLEMASYYKAALEEASVGGDFLDVFPLDANQVVFAVGDLSGKGLAAASQVATVRNMLRYSLYRTSRLDRAVLELNDALVRHDLLTGFATLFVGIYDPASRVLTYLSCGHDPSLLRRRGNGEIVLLPADGAAISPVLGMVEGGTFTQQSVTLQPGDALLLCTDGITEAGRSRGEFLGVSGVADLLRQGEAGENVEGLVARMAASVRGYARGVQHDDVCLLAAVVSA